MLCIHFNECEMLKLFFVCHPLGPPFWLPLYIASLSLSWCCAMCTWKCIKFVCFLVRERKTKREYGTEEVSEWERVYSMLYTGGSGAHKFHSPALFVVIIYVLCTLRATHKMCFVQGFEIKTDDISLSLPHFLNNTYLQCVMWTLFFRYPKIIVYTFFISLSSFYDHSLYSCLGVLSLFLL